MATREPVLLVVLIECAAHRWYVAAIDFQGAVSPLLCSEPGSLAAYVGQELDEQVTCLRHRLSGVLQHGCDRLWGRGQKPALIVFALDQLFPHAAAGLTQHVADHFVEWMTNPPVVFLLAGDGPAGWQTLAGDWPAEARAAFEKSWDELAAAQTQRHRWEVIPTPR